VRYDYHRVYDGHTTLSANAAWRPTQLTILRASYAEGFKAPALSQIYGDGGVFTAKNLNLKPETATSYEIGIEQSALGRTLRASMTYYNRHTHDLIQYAFAPSSACSSGFCGINQNVARANAEGLEAAVTIAPVPAFTASFNFTHGKSYDATSGLRLLRRPDDSIALNADWDAGRLKLGGTLQMVGSSFDTDSNTFSRVRIPSHVLAGARATLPIGAHLELYSRIDNLFDAQYQAVRHYGTLGRAGYIGVRVKS
jgi:vitamin B12 transporter